MQPIEWLLTFVGPQREVTGRSPLRRESDCFVPGILDPFFPCFFIVLEESFETDHGNRFSGLKLLFLRKIEACLEGGRLMKNCFGEHDFCALWNSATMVWSNNGGCAK